MSGDFRQVHVKQVFLPNSVSILINEVSLFQECIFLSFVPFTVSGSYSFHCRIPGRLKSFVADLHSGKLHREFHHGPDVSRDYNIPTPRPPTY